MHSRRTIPAQGWLALAGVMVIALLVRLVGYNFSLPYIDHSTEPVFYLTGRLWRGLFSAGNYLAGYPPLYIWLNIIAQSILEAFGVYGIAPTVQFMRLIAIGFSLLTLLLIFLAARMGGGWFAGILAGAAWAVAPLVVESGVDATPDPLVYLLVIAAVTFAVVALVEPKRAHWCMWSIAAGCLAILTKYFVLTAVLPGILVTIFIFKRDRKRAWRYMGIQAILLVGTGVASLFGIAVLSLAGVSREGATARAEGLANVLNFSRVLNNLYYALVPINASFFIVTIILGTLAYGVAQRRQRIRTEILFLCLLILITLPWLAAAFSLVSATERMKDVLPATTIACVVLGLALAQIAVVLPRFLRGLVVVVPAILVFAPQLATDFALMQDRQLPDSRVALRQWADVNLTPGTVLVGIDNHKTFNPYYGGIEGQHWFDWIVTDNMFQKSAEAWRLENGISYIVMDRSTRDELQDRADGEAYLAPMLYLQDFASANERGPQVVVYRVWSVQHETEARFGDPISLLGYDLSADSAAPGDSLTLTFYWRAEMPPADNYSLFVHFVPHGENTLVAQIDGAPARVERPTLTWTDSDEVLISQPFVMTIPPDTLPGDYEIRIGLYNYQSGIRLPVTTSTQTLDDSLVLTPITVQ